MKILLLLVFLFVSAAFAFQAGNYTLIVGGSPVPVILLPNTTASGISVSAGPLLPGFYVTAYTLDACTVYATLNVSPYSATLYFPSNGTILGTFSPATLPAYSFSLKSSLGSCRVHLQAVPDTTHYVSGITTTTNFTLQSTVNVWVVQLNGFSYTPAFSLNGTMTSTSYSYVYWYLYLQNATNTTVFPSSYCMSGSVYAYSYGTPVPFTLNFDQGQCYLPFGAHSAGYWPSSYRLLLRLTLSSSSAVRTNVSLKGTVLNPVYASFDSQFSYSNRTSTSAPLVFSVPPSLFYPYTLEVSANSNSSVCNVNISGHNNTVIATGTISPTTKLVTNTYQTTDNTWLWEVSVLPQSTYQSCSFTVQFYEDRTSGDDADSDKKKKKKKKSSIV